MFINGILDVTGLQSLIIFADLLYTRSHELSFLTARCIQMLAELDFRGAARAFWKRCETQEPPSRDWNPCHLFIWSEIWLNAHGPLGVKICLFLLISHPEFLWITPPICWAWMEDRWADRWHIANGRASLGGVGGGGAPARNGPFMLPVKWGLCDTHTHTHICYLKWAGIWHSSRLADNQWKPTPGGTSSHERSSPAASQTGIRRTTPSLAK